LGKCLWADEEDWADEEVRVLRELSSAAPAILSDSLHTSMTEGQVWGGGDVARTLPFVHKHRRMNLLEQEMISLCGYLKILWA